jgi:hypothetical protein
MKALISNS